jgi:hypothetical protein
MKNVLSIGLLAGVTCLALTFCKKDDSHSAPLVKPVLTLSKTDLEKGEPLTVSTVANNTAVVRWSVYPSGNSLISAATRSSSLLFSAAGGYTITANYFTDSGSAVPYDSASSPVTVNDSLYQPPTGQLADTLSLAGDELMVQPYAASDSAGFVLMVQSKKVYNCSPIFIGYSYGLTNGTVEASFNLISDPTWDCSGFQNHAVAALFYPTLAPGDYAVSINFNGTDYAGSVNFSGSVYTFTWPYTSGVVISPLTIQKQ